MTITFWLLAVLLIVLGILGTVLPGLPGPTLVLGGLILGAWIDGFQRVGWVTLAALGVLTLVLIVAAGLGAKRSADLVAAGLGAKRLGASWAAVAGAFVGTVLGLFAGFVGLIVGPFLGAVAGELLTGRDMSHAGKIGFGTWLGLVFGVAIKLGLVCTMLGIFATAFVL